MYGGSYNGFTQWAAAKSHHPALKTIVPQAATAPGIDASALNKTHGAGILPWINGVTQNKWVDEIDLNEQFTGSWSKVYKKWFVGDFAHNKLDSVEGRPSAWFQKYLKHPSYDQFWQSMIPYKREFAKVNIPVLTITGYSDGDETGALYYFNELHRYNPTAESYLVIGPFDHFEAQGETTIMSKSKVDAVAKIDINRLVYDWFDYTLKNGSKPSFLKDKVNYETPGTNAWLHVPSLKQMNNDSLTFYLSPSGKERRYGLTKGKTGGFVKQNVEFTRRQTEEKKEGLDILVKDTNNVAYETEVLKNDMTINGSFTATLDAAINKKDMDVAAMLIVKQPDGKYTMLSYVLQRASYSKDRSKRNLFTPGKPESIYLNGRFISSSIAKGSKLILMIAPIFTSNYEINYGTGKDVATETIANGKVPLQIKWFGDSKLTVPVKMNTSVNKKKF